MPDPIRIFIGYDPRETEAWEVCRYSIRRHASEETSIKPLVQQQLRLDGLYRRTHFAHEGVMYDDIDGKPFSTEFAFTRFLVPHLCNFGGWALFMDGDMMVRRDISQLWALRDNRYAVMCVKHDYLPMGITKKDGAIQEPYLRKNWSSLVLWNCGHPSNAVLTVEAVNEWTGGTLHQFSWLKDEEIGALSEEWNWLEGWSPEDIDPAIVHFTSGGPWLDAYRDVDYAGEWLSMRQVASLDAAYT